MIYVYDDKALEAQSAKVAAEGGKHSKKQKKQQLQLERTMKDQDADIVTAMRISGNTVNVVYGKTTGARGRGWPLSDDLEAMVRHVSGLAAVNWPSSPVQGALLMLN